MSKYFIGAGIAIFLGICFLIYKKIIGKKRFQKYVEKSKALLPKIEEFNSEINSLESKYTTHKEGQILKDKWTDFYRETSRQYFPSKIPDC